MAIYRVNPGDLSTGSGVPAGLTSRWHTDAAVSVIEDATSPSGKSVKLLFGEGDAARTLLSIDSIDADPDRDTFDAIARLRINNSPSSTEASRIGICGRASGNDSAEEGIIGGMGDNASGTDIRAIYYPSASFDTSTEDDVWVSGTIYFLRVRVDDAGLTVDLYPENDPLGTPIDTHTDDTQSSSSDDWIGLFGFAGSTDVDWQYIGVGTGTDSAPLPAAYFIGTVATLNGAVNAAFDEDLSEHFTGYLTPFIYSLQSGTLPDGLSLDESTGVISGTPTTEEEATGLVVRATDDDGNAADTNSFSIDIAAETSVRLEVDELLYVDKAKSSLLNDTGYTAYVIDPTGPTVSEFAVDVVNGVVGIEDALYDTVSETFKVALEKGDIKGFYPATVTDS